MNLNGLLILLGVIAAVLLGRACYWLVTAESAQARVESLSWTHRTFLHERRVFSDGHWGSPPSVQGAYDEPTFDWSCYDRQDGTVCVAHDDDDGHCTAEAPDYRRWCDYRYYDWPVIDTKVVSGRGYEMTWETFGSRLDALHRETGGGSYEVKFVHPKGEQWTYETDNEYRYRQFVVGDYWRLKLPHVGSMEPTAKLDLEKK